MALQPRTLALQPETLALHPRSLALRPQPRALLICKTHQLESDEELYQHHEGMEDRRGFQSPHVAITFLGPQNSMPLPFLS